MGSMETDLLVLRIGEQRTCILANMVRAQRHVAAEARVFEILIGEVEVGEVRGQPLRAGKCPERESILSVGRRAVVIDDLVRSQQRDASCKMQPAVEQFRGIEVSLLKGVAQSGIGDESIDELTRMGALIAPEQAANVCQKRRKNPRLEQQQNAAGKLQFFRPSSKSGLQMCREDCQLPPG